MGHWCLAQGGSELETSGSYAVEDEHVPPEILATQGCQLVQAEEVGHSPGYLTQRVAAEHAGVTAGGRSVRLELALVVADTPRFAAATFASAWRSSKAVPSVEARPASPIRC